MSTLQVEPATPHLLPLARERFVIPGDLPVAGRDDVLKTRLRGWTRSARIWYNTGRGQQIGSNLFTREKTGSDSHFGHPDRLGLSNTRRGTEASS